MNIKLSCTADKKMGRGAYIIYKGGKRVVSESFSIKGMGESSTLKEYVFVAVTKALLSVRNIVNHEDLLLIELPNNHMVEWLNGSKEYKGYNKYLDEISDIIDTIDCRYLFTKSDVNEVKKMLEVKEEEKIQGIMEAFEGM